MTSRARTITDQDDLSAIHDAAEGFVFYPFGRKVHSARCPTVPGMALNPNEPRWFAPDVATARAFQAERSERYPTARPFESVRCCAALIPETLVARHRSTEDAAHPEPVPSSREDWTIRSSPRAVELWTTTRTRFGDDQSPVQRAMIRTITPQVASLRCGANERLHGIFVSDEVTSRQPDAENIAFYNFGSAPFAGAGSTLGFERSYAAAPAAPRPLDPPARFFHRWEVVADDAPFASWQEGESVAAWDVPVDLAGDLGLAAWRALREHPDAVEARATLTAAEPFGIEAVLAVPGVHQPSVVQAIKGLVDGPLAGLQRADELEPEVIARLLRRRRGRPIDEPTLRSLIEAPTPPPVLPRAPFNRNGLDPCDELCVTGIARVVPTVGEARLRGRVFRVEANDLTTVTGEARPR